MSAVKTQWGSYVVDHQRSFNGEVKQRSAQGEVLDPTGGCTQVFVYVHGVGVGRGVARCNRSDMFDQRVGERLALERAFSNAEEELRKVTERWFGALAAARKEVFNGAASRDTANGEHTEGC